MLKLIMQPTMRVGEPHPCIWKTNVQKMLLLIEVASGARKEVNPLKLGCTIIRVIHLFLVIRV